MAYTAKSRIVVTLDAPSSDPFDSTKRQAVAHISANLVKCDFKYRPADGGMVEASIEVRAKRDTALRERLESGAVGLVSIYRGNHKTRLPKVSGSIIPFLDWDTNSGAYLLFQGMLDNPKIDPSSDVVAFNVRGLGKWLEDVEYTGSFQDESIIDIANTVLTEVIARDNQPFKAMSISSTTITAGVPNVHHALHKRLVGLREYKDAPVSKILRELQDEAGGKSVVAWGARCRDTTDEFAAVYFRAWVGDKWNPAFQNDEEDLDEAAHIPKLRTAKQNWRIDTSAIKNSVTVYGAKTANGLDNFSGSSEVAVSVKEHGRRHETVINEDLPTEEACLEYAAAWLQENSARKIVVDAEWLDDQTLQHSRREGGGADAVPRDPVYYLKLMNRPLHFLESGDGFGNVNGDAAPYAGINCVPSAVQLTKVGSGDVPHIYIDTTKAPFYGGAWNASDEYGHPNKDLTWATQGSTRSLIWGIRYGITDSTAALDGRVLVEWSKRLRLKLKQSGGATANYGFTIESWRGAGTGWVDELTSTEEGAAYGITEVIPNTHGATGAGAMVYFEIQGNTSTYPRCALWSSSSYPWRTLLAGTNASKVRWGASTSHLQYAHLAGNQVEDFILLGCGTQSDGVTPDAATSGNWEIYGIQCDDGLYHSGDQVFKYGNGMNAEGITNWGTGAYDANESFIAQSLFRHLPRSQYEGSLLMKMEPVISSTITPQTGDDEERYFMRWGRAPLGTYEGFELDGLHAELMNAQSGDGLLNGSDVTTAADVEVDQGIRQRNWRLGAGARRRRLGEGITVYPYAVEFSSAGEHSPLKIKVRGGTASDSIANSTEAILERIDQNERKATEAL